MHYLNSKCNTFKVNWWSNIQILAIALKVIDLWIQVVEFSRFILDQFYYRKRIIRAKPIQVDRVQIDFCSFVRKPLETLGFLRGY